MCSLWYLPFLLAAYVFHSRNWHRDEDRLEHSVEADEDKVKIAKAILAAKEAGKGFCMHEVIANKASNEGNENPLCPPVLVKDITEGKMEVEVGNGSDSSSLKMSSDSRNEKNSPSLTIDIVSNAGRK